MHLLPEWTCIARTPRAPRLWCGARVGGSSDGVAVRRGGARGLASLLARNADYRRLFAATVVSYLGDWFAFVAVSGLVVELTGRKDLPAVVFAASVLPVALLSPVAGVLADRVDRKRLMVAVDVVRVVPALAMLGAVWWGSPALAIGCVVVLAALSTFFEPVASAVVPNLVEGEELALAQAALSSVWGSMLFVGAALGGLVAVTLGREASFVINAVTFLVSAVLVLRVRRPTQQRREARPQASVGLHLSELWALAKAHRPTRALMLAKAGVGLGNGIVGLLPAFAVTRFGTGDAGVGVLLAARGLGALLGPFVAQRLARGKLERLYVVIGLSMVAYGLAYVFLPFASSLELAALCVVGAHLGGGAQWVLSTYGLQVTTPDALAGRVLSVDFGIATLSIGVSSLVAGAAAERWGLGPASWALAGVSVAYGVTWLAWTRGLWRPKG